MVTIRKKNQKNGLNIHVWDAEGFAPECDNVTIVLWASFSGKDNKNIISLPKFVEDHSAELRSRYLSWIYELGEKQVNNKNIVDHLELRPGFSFWWMTLISEKSIFKSPQIFDVIKLFALEDIHKKIQPVKIIFTSSNKKLSNIISKWCKSMKVECEIHLLHSIKEKPSFLRIYRSFPGPLLALLGLLRHTFQRFPFHRKHTLKANNADITFIDYFINLAPDSISSGNFGSNYWTELVDLLREENKYTNWLHKFIPHKELNTSNSAIDLMRRFNKSSDNKEQHLMLNGVVDFSMAFKIFIDYCKILKSGISLLKIKEHFQPSFSAINFWDLYKDEWAQSIYGTIAMESLINFNLFDYIFSGMNKQKVGFYLLENQNWEKAMIYCWKKNGHGTLIGVAHSTVRFWDLRYFYDTKSYEVNRKNPLPMPDQVVLNGPVAMNEYILGKYPKKQLLEGEALRYIYLANKSKALSYQGPIFGLKILACGDIDAGATHKMMQWLEKIYISLPQNTTVTVKSHPAQEILPGNYPSLPIAITLEPLGKILQDYDVVYASYSTSAAVDVYCSGLPVVQVLDGKTFNMSPLRGLNSVTYVTDPVELAAALISSQKKELVISETYFYLDKDLPRWRGILSPEILN